MNWLKTAARKADDGLIFGSIIGGLLSGIFALVCLAGWGLLSFVFTVDPDGTVITHAPWLAKWFGISFGTCLGTLCVRGFGECYVYYDLITHPLSPFNGLLRRWYGLCGESKELYTLNGKERVWCCLCRGHTGNHMDGTNPQIDQNTNKWHTEREWV